MRIKVNPEDFLVDEILDESLLSERGSYHIYKLKKKNYTTERAVSHLARALKIPRKHISYAGTKDKQAITTQYISIKGVSKEHVLSIELDDISLEFIGFAKEQLFLGDLLGNKFTINVYDVDMIEVKENFSVPNYFDDQRFSTHNVQIGLHMLKKEFKEAVSLIVESDNDFSSIITDYLENHHHDYVGSLRKLPSKTLMFYVHAVQSLIFNDSVSSFIEQTQDNFTVEYSQGTLIFPKELATGSEEELDLVGFDKSSDMLPKYNLSTRDFIIRQLPELSLEGASRKIWNKVEQCSSQKIENGVQVTFNLQKGCYATIVLRQLFKDSFAK